MLLPAWCRIAAAGEGRWTRHGLPRNATWAPGAACILRQENRRQRSCAVSAGREVSFPVAKKATRIFTHNARIVAVMRSYGSGTRCATACLRKHRRAPGGHKGATAAPIGTRRGMPARGDGSLSAVRVAMATHSGHVRRRPAPVATGGGGSSTGRPSFARKPGGIDSRRSHSIRHRKAAARTLPATTSCAGRLLHIGTEFRGARGRLPDEAGPGRFPGPAGGSTSGPAPGRSTGCGACRPDLKNGVRMLRAQPRTSNEMKCVWASHVGPGGFVCV